MAAVLLGQFPPNSAEWHEARASRIGGSEVAPILGLSPWESHFSLWHRKAAKAGPVDLSAQMEWGLRLEAAVLAKFCDEHPEFTPADGGTFVHSERDWQCANPDLIGYVAGELTLVEAKTGYADDGWGEQGTDQVPVWYRCQALWYCDVFDAERIHLAVLLGGSDYREYVVTYDETEAVVLRDAAERFLASIAADERPDIDAHSATYTVIRELHPDIDSVDVPLPTDLASQYVTARHALKAAETAEQLARSLVADHMGSARKATWDGHTIASRQARGDGVPYVVAGRKLPEIHADNTEQDAA